MNALLWIVGWCAGDAPVSVFICFPPFGTPLVIQMLFYAYENSARPGTGLSSLMSDFCARPLSSFSGLAAGLVTLPKCFDVACTGRGHSKVLILGLSRSRISSFRKCSHRQKDLSSRPQEDRSRATQTLGEVDEQGRVNRPC